MNLFGSVFLTAFIALAGAAIGIIAGHRWMLQRWIRKSTRLILTETYAENLWELVTSSRRFKPQKIVELALRSESPEAIARSWGTPKKMPHFEGLTFLPAQLAVLPTKESRKIDTHTRIGHRARRPLQLQIPLIVSGMGTGVALSEPMKLAIAKGASEAGTATNTGEGPLMEEERKQADKLILQYSRGDWPQNPEDLLKADMIEIPVGTGGNAGTPCRIPFSRLNGDVRRQMNLQPGKGALIRSRVPGVDRPEDWKRLVSDLREITDGIPIGVKLVPSRVEDDLRLALEADVDFITMDGAQGGVRESAPVLQDDFGLPTIRGLVRTVRFLEEKGVRDRISVIVSGGLYTPGDYLKALALGADAVALGTVVVMAAMHTQITQVLPWEPPSQLAWSDGAFAGGLDVEAAARNVANLLNSSVEEMKLAIMCLGKKGIHEVNREDLVALDPETARITGVPLAYERRDDRV